MSQETQRFGWVRIVLAFTVWMALFAATAVTYGWYYYQAPGPLVQENTRVFKKGAGFQAIVDELAAQNIIRHPWLFKAIAVALGDARTFKAGEYRFSAAISPRLVMDMIAEGRVVVRKLTIPEGLTSQEVIDLLSGEPALEGTLPAAVREGSLLPETYHFTYGDARQELLERMQTGMKATLEALWRERMEGLPFTRMDEALTLASIVEKETGIDHERGRVAAVFINRLRKGMKLQSDPTVTYGLVAQSGIRQEKPLTLTDLRTPTPYNTYVINGLPPGPIANPGRESIRAVLNPPETDELYFVATGSGGHHFSKTLEQHNEYVRQYREKMRQAKP